MPTRPQREPVVVLRGEDHIVRVRPREQIGPGGRIEFSRRIVEHRLEVIVREVRAVSLEVVSL
jgi:hypothetical protein